MSDDPTVPPLRVVGEDAAWEFDRPFTVGREEVCEVCFDGHARVSRAHLRVFPENGTWWVEDLGSANGLYVGGERVQRVAVAGETAVQVGEGGPFLTLSPSAVSVADDASAGPTPSAFALDDDDLTVQRPRFAAAPDETPHSASGDGTSGLPPEAPKAPEAPLVGATRPVGADGKPLSYEDVVKHYFSDDPDDPDAGERTRFIRQAYGDIQQATEREHNSKQSRYRMLLIAALAVCVVSVSYAGYREYSIRQLRGQAQEMFIQLQSYNVTIAEQVVAVQDQIEAQPELADSLQVNLDAALEARRQTAARYDQFVRGIGVYDGLSSEEEAIYRVARAFGESEITIPPEFVDEVKVYVAKWKRSNRFQTAVRTAEVNGYIPITVAALRRYGLPPEFFYLALQESNFDTRIVGPPTRYGYAKGAWQFIPETGRRYGLATGPLVAQAVYDPQDQRQDFDSAAPAAAHYLHDIYVHLSQASGLLVCASYNWGEGRIRRNMDDIQRQLRQAGIPNDPSHRTYWRFLTEYRNQMPNETRDYVMNIFAAAVIGQNPRMFGINMDPPLSSASIARSAGAVRSPSTGSASGRVARLGSAALGNTPDAPAP